MVLADSVKAFPFAKEFQVQVCRKLPLSKLLEAVAGPSVDNGVLASAKAGINKSTAMREISAEQSVFMAITVQGWDGRHCCHVKAQAKPR